MALAGQWGSSERVSVQGGFTEAAQVETDPSAGLCFFVSLLLQPSHSSEQSIFHKLRLPKSNECSNLERHDTYFKTAPRSASLSLASPGSSPVQGIMSASVYLSTKG